METPDLKPCPFCGAQPKFIQQPVPSPLGQEPEYDVGCFTPGCFVQHGGDWYLNMQMAADTWNDRPGKPKEWAPGGKYDVAAVKKYLLFAGHRYYPLGGTADFQGSSDDLEELKQLFLDNATNIANGSYIENWGQLVDRDTLKTLWHANISISYKRRPVKWKAGDWK